MAIKIGPETQADRVVYAEEQDIELRERDTKREACLQLAKDSNQTVLADEILLQKIFTMIETAARQTWISGYSFPLKLTFNGKVLTSTYSAGPLTEFRERIKRIDCRLDLPNVGSVDFTHYKAFGDSHPQTFNSYDGFAPAGTWAAFSRGLVKASLEYGLGKTAQEKERIVTSKTVRKRWWLLWYRTFETQNVEYIPYFEVEVQEVRNRKTGSRSHEDVNVIVFLYSPSFEFTPA